MSRISRRQALTVATVGVGLTAGTVVGIASARDGGAEGDLVMVRVRDLGSGTLDLFTATGKVRVRDKDLCRRLAAAARRR